MKMLLGTFLTIIVFATTIPSAFAKVCEGLPAKYVDQASVLAQNQNHEIRFFIEAPLDPMRGECDGNIQVFARMIPKGAFAGRASKERGDHKNSPTLFFIFGGPAFSSEWYTLSYDWDYENQQLNSEKVNSLRDLNKYFNIVVMDQRGNPGYSNPLDTSNHDGINLEALPKLFNPTTLAFDQAKVIDRYVQEGLVNPKNFYVLGHSFGEIVMWNYANLIHIGKFKHKPKGLIGSSGNKPFGNLMRQQAATRENLEAYSRRIQQWSLDKKNGKKISFANLMLKIRKKMRVLGKNPDLAYVYYWLTPDSLHEEKAIYEGYEALWNDFNDPTKDPKVVYDEFQARNVDQTNILNNSMCVEGLLGGHVDVLEKKVGNFSEPWMLNPFKVYLIEEEFTLPRLKAVPDKAYKTPEPYNMGLRDVRVFLRKGIPVALHWGRWDTLASGHRENIRLIMKVNNLALYRRVTISGGTHLDIQQERTFKKVFKTLGLNLK